MLDRFMRNWFMLSVRVRGVGVEMSGLGSCRTSMSFYEPPLVLTSPLAELPSVSVPVFS